MYADKLSLSHLEQYLAKAAWILKGPIGASDFKAYIFPMLFFKRISDVYDEEYRQALEESDGDEEYAQLPEFHKFIVPEGCHWNDVRETTVNVGLAIEKALRGIEQVKAKGGDYRTLKLYGQEKNLTSSAIARMNMFLHGVEDFRVERGDTLRQPAFFAADGLQTFDCVIANPPFSLKEWGATAWTNDPYGRNIAGVPPQGNGDMAWVQHMIKSMQPKTGRMAVVLPHGALFRKAAEGKIRKALLEMDLLEAVIGLGPNIFYGTQLAACVMVFRTKKPAAHRNKVLFIDASEQIRVGRAQNFLEPEHVDRIYQWYLDYQDVENYVKVASMDEIAENDHNLNIPLYVEKIIEDDLPTVEEALADLKQAWEDCQKAEAHLKSKLEEFGVKV